MELAPVDRPSGYFAIAAAVAGICGGLRTTAGRFLAQRLLPVQVPSKLGSKGE